MDPELPQIFLATDVDGEGFNMEHNGDYEQNPKSVCSEATYEDHRAWLWES